MAELMPEPPDGARIEWEHWTDMYAAWRDDASSAEAGWTPGGGGEVWCVYPGSVPCTWTSLVDEFGDSLRNARRLYTEAELAEAVAAGGYEHIGDHIIGRATGICTVHGERYEIPHELDRLREREGGGRG